MHSDIIDQGETADEFTQRVVTPFEALFKGTATRVPVAFSGPLATLSAHEFTSGELEVRRSGVMLFRVAPARSGATIVAHLIEMIQRDCGVGYAEPDAEDFVDVRNILGVTLTQAANLAQFIHTAAL